jgi:2-keto-4-pentenoate hydratase
MSQSRHEAAIDALIGARRTGRRIATLPLGSAPRDLAEAHALQDATVTKLGERVAGWKVAFGKDREVMRGIIVGSRILRSPASLPASDVPMLGVEGEIAFLFDRDLPPRNSDYSIEEVSEAVIPLVGIEIVSSRFEDYSKTPLLDRTADCMSNGAFIAGTLRPDWRQVDLSKLRATLRVNGKIAVQKTGSHPTVDPILPAVALGNLLRHTTGVNVGQIVTTGTCTGLYFAAPGDAIEVTFTELGSATVTLTR